MDETIVEGKKATYRITSELVPPNPPGKVYVDALVDVVAVNVATGEEAHRERYELRQQHNNSDLAAAKEIVKRLAANDFK